MQLGGGGVHTATTAPFTLTRNDVVVNPTMHDGDDDDEEDGDDDDEDGDEDEDDDRREHPATAAAWSARTCRSSRGRRAKGCPPPSARLDSAQQPWV